MAENNPFNVNPSSTGGMYRVNFGDGTFSEVTYDQLVGAADKLREQKAGSYEIVDLSNPDAIMSATDGRHYRVNFSDSSSRDVSAQDLASKYDDLSQLNAGDYSIQTVYGNVDDVIKSRSEAKEGTGTYWWVKENGQERMLDQDEYNSMMAQYTDKPFNSVAAIADARRNGVEVIGAKRDDDNKISNSIYADRYQVAIPGQEPQVMDATELAANREQIYAENPDAQITRFWNYRPGKDDGEGVEYLVYRTGIDAPQTYTKKELDAIYDDLKQQDPGVQIIGTKADDYREKVAAAARKNLDDFKAKNDEEIAELRARIKSDDYRINSASAPKDQAFYDKHEADKKRLEELEGELDNLTTAWSGSDYEKGRRQYMAEASKEQQARYYDLSQDMGLHGNEMGPQRAALSDNDRFAYKLAAKHYGAAAVAWEAPDASDKNSFLKNMKKGAADAFMDPDFWTMSLTELGDAMVVRNIVKDLKAAMAKDGLSIENDLDPSVIDKYLAPSDAALLQAWLADANAQSERALSLGRGYTAGETAADSAVFMAQFLLTGNVAGAIGRKMTKAAAKEGAEGAAKAVGKGLVRWIGRALAEGNEAAIRSTGAALAKKLGSTALKKTAVAATKAAAGIYKYGARPVTQGVIHTVLQPATYKDMAEQLVKAELSDDIVNQGQVMWQSVLDQFIENWSESVGVGIEAAMGGLLKLGGNVGLKALKLGDKLKLGKMTPAQWAQFIVESGPMKLMHEAGFNGFFGEMGEEWIGNAARVLVNEIGQKRAIANDMTGVAAPYQYGMTKQEFIDWTKLDSQLDMAASFAPMSLFGLGSSSVAAYKHAMDYAEIADKMKAILPEIGGMTADEVNDMFSSFQTKEQLREKLRPVFENILGKAQRGDQKAVENIQDVFKFAQQAGLKSIITEAQNYYEQQQRDILNDQIRATLGAASAEDERGIYYNNVGRKGADGRTTYNEEVTVMTNRDGQWYVIDMGGSQYLLKKTDGTQAKAIGKKEYEKQIANGSITAESMGRRQYLQNEVQKAEAAREQQRMEQEAQTKRNALVGRLQSDPTIDFGGGRVGTAVEMLPEGVHVHFDTEVAMDGRNSQDHIVSYEQVGNAINIDQVVRTKQEEDQAKARQFREDRKREHSINKAAKGKTFNLGDQVYTFHVIKNTVHDEQTGDTFFNVVAADKDGKVTTVQIEQSYLEDQVKEMAPVAESGETEATERVISEERLNDNRPRDFRGNLIPLKEDGSVDEAALWKNDKEAWFRWNDARRGGDTANSISKLDKMLAALPQKLAQLEQEYDMATIENNFDECNRLEAEINQLTSEINEYTALRESYNMNAEQMDRDFQFQQKLDRNARMQRLAGSEEQLQGLAAERAQILSEYLGGVITDGTEFQVCTTGNLVETVKADIEALDQKAQAEAINDLNEIQEALMNGVIFPGFYLRSLDKIYFVNEFVRDLNEARTTAVHEHQHKITYGSGLDIQLSQKVSAEECLQAVKAISGTSFYDKKKDEVIADEAISHCMEVVANNANLSVEEALKAAGVKSQNLINFIANIENEQRESEDNLLAARRNSYGGSRLRVGDTADGAAEIAGSSSMGEQGSLAPEGGETDPAADLASRGIVSSDGEALFSVKYAPTEEQAEAVIADIMAETGVSEEEARSWVQSETSLAAIILDESSSDMLNYEGDDRYSAIKDDSDYPQGTVDFNNICRKRLPFTNMYQRIQKAYPNTIITGEDLAIMRQVMKDNGLMVACGLCYVEDRRQLLGEIALDFINEYKNDFKGYETRGGDTKKERAQLLRDMVANDRKDDLSIYDLITLEGSTQLYREHRALYDAFNQFNKYRGQQSGNLFQGYAEYKREILRWSDAKVRKVNSLGGLRIFSYSDFEAHHLIDIVQIIQDCARRGVMIQGYTKVPSFARAVKDTNIKLNRSLIPLGDLGYHLDEEGKVVLDYDPVEGIDVSDADFLDTNDNVGNIIIGINDTQIAAAMLDPFVHYIIPYHSNQSGALRQLKQTGAWYNYKNEQTDKGGKGHGVNIYTEVLEAAEKEGNPIQNERQFVDKFLAVCKEKGYTPRFSRFLNKDANGDYTYRKGYYKLLLDYKLFDENGNILPQKPVVAQFDDEFNKTILDRYVAEETESLGENLDEIYNEVVARLGLESREPSVRARVIDQDQQDAIALINGIDDLQGYIREVNEYAEQLMETGMEGELAWARINEKYPNLQNLVNYGIISESDEAADGSDFFKLNTWTIDELKADSEAAEEAAVRFSVVSDQAEIDRLESEELIPVYQSAVKINGKYYPPMATLTEEDENGKAVLGAPYDFGQWIKADEHPERLATKGKQKGKYPLKQKGKTTWVAYNPYLHTTASPLNDQFTAAHNKPLVVIEVMVPKSELEGKYHAEGAKDSTGEMSWHSGPVSAKLAELGKERKVILTRWAKPMREVPAEELAGKISDMLKGTDIAIPINVVSAELREELVKKGVKFGAIKGTVGKNEKPALQAELQRIKDLYKERKSDVRFKAVNDVEQEYAPKFAEIRREYEQKKQEILGHGGKMTPAEWKEHRDELSRIGKERDEKLNPLMEEYANAMTRAEEEDRNNAPKYDVIGAADAERGNRLFAAAKEEFGTTNDFREAGYIVPDGDMIDLSGKDNGGEAGRRQNDHRDINQVITDRKYATVTEYMDDFINEGAIRIAPEVGLVSLANKPTKEQKDKLRDYLYKHSSEGVQVEILEGSKTVANPIYRERTSPTRVINDINEYFDNGVVPSGNARFKVVNDNQQIFVSNAAAALDRIPMKKGNAQAWINKLQQAGGMKKEEDKWLGLSTWLKDQKGDIAKESIAEFIEQHQVQIEETHYADDADFTLMDKKYPGFSDAFEMGYNRFDGHILLVANMSEALSLYEQFGDGSMDVDDMDHSDLVNFGKSLLEKENLDKPINDTRREYTTDGLENKREIALTVPTIDPYNQDDDIHFGDAGEGRAIAWIRFGESTIYEDIENAKNNAKMTLNDYRRSLGIDGSMSYSERVEVENSLSDEQMKKLRELDDVANDIHGGAAPVAKVLVIDEIQSKRHQDAKENGYKGEIQRLLDARPDYDETKLENLHEEGNYWIAEYAGNTYYAPSELSEWDAKRIIVNQIQSEIIWHNEHRGVMGEVPDAPFRDNWHELAMKRMLRLAAEEGYDKIAWTNGTMQADRYNLGTIVKRISGGIDADGNRLTLIEFRNQGIMTYFHDESGNITSVMGPEIEGLPEAENISDLIGKDKAKAILDVTERGTKGLAVFEGTDLISGADGMRFFYDQKLVNWMNKYGKQWGVKVEDLSLPDLQNEDGWHSIDVTPEMKESVMGGQVMFRAVEITPETRAEMEQINAIARVNGTYLKAPNGADTKLNPEQWSMVRTKAFKNWFGDWENDPANASKVVDENGEPRVMMHVTHVYGFNKFFAGNGEALYFTGDKSYAEDFMNYLKADYEGYVEPESFGTYEVFLNVRNPFDAHNNAIPAEVEDIYNRGELKETQVAIEEINDFGGSKILTSKGYDGAISDDMTVVVSPNQIKSATNNSGNFDPTDPDIRFSIIGEKAASRDNTIDGIHRLANLNEARAMEAQLKPKWGVSDDENALKIKVATGWERGADGKWRYEVEDIKLKPFDDWIMSKKKLKLGDIVEMGTVLRLYPELADYDVIKKTGKLDIGAAINNEDKYIKLPFGAIKEDIKNYEKFGFDSFREELKKDLREFYLDVLHEIQHGIQYKEGFAKGGSPSTLTPEGLEKIDQLDAEMHQVWAQFDALPEEKKVSWNPEVRLLNARANAIDKSMKEAFRRYAIGEAGYKALAGEVESRNAEARHKMSMEERRNSLLASTEDVAREDQLFFYNAMGEDQSIRFSVRPGTQAKREGLEAIIGSEAVGTLATDIFGELPETIKYEVTDRALINGGSFTKAVFEVFSNMAEKDELTDQEIQAVKTAREKIMVAITDPDLSKNDALWIMYNETARNLRDGDLLDRKHWQSVRRKLGQTQSVLGRRLTLDDIVEAANETSEDVAKHSKALGDIMDELADIKKVADAQKGYDRITVGRLTDLVDLMIQAKVLDSATNKEIRGILETISEANGMSDIAGQVDHLYSVVLDGHLRRLEEGFAKVLKTKAVKVTSKKVSEQGALDLTGQEFMDAFKKGIALVGAPKGYEQLENLIAKESEKVAEGVDGHEHLLQGYVLAKQYIDEVQHYSVEHDSLERDLKGMEEQVELGQMRKEDFEEFKAEMEKAMLSSRTDQAKGLATILQDLIDVTKASHSLAIEFLREQQEHANQVLHNANSDMKGLPDKQQKDEPKGMDRFVNGLANTVLAPLGTFDQMLRLFGQKSVSGEGYLWNRFMRGWIDATGNEYSGVQARFAEIDAKVSSVMGKDLKWSDLYRWEKKIPKMTIKYIEGVNEDGTPKEYTKELSQGQMLYIYLVNQMTDGRMKLRAMGIKDEDVKRIETNLEPEVMELGRYMVDEFLPACREEYNEVHKRVFGAPMDNIDNYFPLKINADSRTKKEDVSTAGDAQSNPSTITSNIIKRVRNATAIDLNTDAFSVLIEHIQNMEHWAAFAEWNRDINTLISSTKFRNQVKNMKSVYGTGDNLWDNFVSSVRIAAGTYKPKTNKRDRAIMNFASGVTAAKISCRVFTALKQFMSYPAYLAEANPMWLAKSTATPWVSWNWAMENLPVFQKRWKSRQAGDHILKQGDNWRLHLLEVAGRIGMTPNAAVDALTVSIGAYAIYKSKYDKYIRFGYSPEAADRKAKQDAVILYNETQQSNENAFLSSVQMDRTLAASALTVFRNSSMGYQRQLHDAIRNLAKQTPDSRKAMVEFMTKQAERDGLSPEDAKKYAKAMVNRQAMKDTIRVMIFGYGMQLAWNLGSYLPYIIFGDDDETKDEFWHDVFVHSIFGGVEGFLGGNIMSEGLNMLVQGKSFKNWNPTLLPILADWDRMVNEFSKDKVVGINELINLAMQMFSGVNPQTLEDIVVAAIDASNRDLGLAKESLFFAMRFLQVPQSQIDKLWLDEIDAAAKDFEGATPIELIERYANYKLNRKATLSRWMYGDVEEADALSKLAKRYSGDTKDREQDKEVNEMFLDISKEVKKTQERESELRKLYDEGNEAARQELMEIVSDPSYGRKVNMAREYDKYNGLIKNAIESRSREEMNEYFRQATELKEKMVRDYSESQSTEAVLRDAYTFATEGYLAIMAKEDKKAKEAFIKNSPEYEAEKAERQKMLEDAGAKIDANTARIQEIKDRQDEIKKIRASYKYTRANGKSATRIPDHLSKQLTAEGKRLTEERKKLEDENKSMTSRKNKVAKQLDPKPADYMDPQIYNSPEYQAFLKVKDEGTLDENKFVFAEIKELKKRLDETEDEANKKDLEDKIRSMEVQLGNKLRWYMGVEVPDDDEDFSIPE